MLIYDDLLKNNDNDYLEKQTKVFQTKLERKLDLNNADDKWLAVAYVYAKQQGLKEYQCRSFASELTLFITNQLYMTDVDLIYREHSLDSFLNKKFIEMQKAADNEQELWFDFIKYLVGFYKSDYSWKYERVNKFMKFTCSIKEKQMFNDLPAVKPKQKFLLLLKYFDYSLKELDYERVSADYDEAYSINLTLGEYERFMSAAGESKAEKFRNLLYYYYKSNWLL